MPYNTRSRRSTGSRDQNASTTPTRKNRASSTVSDPPSSHTEGLSRESSVLKESINSNESFSKSTPTKKRGRPSKKVESKENSNPTFRQIGSRNNTLLVSEEHSVNQSLDGSILISNSKKAKEHEVLELKNIREASDEQDLSKGDEAQDSMESQDESHLSSDSQDDTESLSKDQMDNENQNESELSEQDGMEAQEESQYESSDDDADKLISNLLDNQKKQVSEPIIKSDLEEDSTSDRIGSREADLDEGSESEYHSFEESEDEVDESQLETLLAMAKENVSSQTGDDSQPKTRAFKDGAFYDPYAQSIKNQLYIQRVNVGSKNKTGLKLQKAQLKKNILVANETALTLSTKPLKRKANNDELELNPANSLSDAKLVRAEVNSAIQVSKNEGLEKLQMNRALPTYDKSKAEARKEKDNNSGSKWFNMPAPIMTEELRRDMEVLKLRSVLDRKRFYKKDSRKAPSKFFQVGTVIEDKSEFYSARLAKKDRKQNFVEEILHDTGAQDYFKSRFDQHQQSTMRNSRKATKLKKFNNRR